MHCSDPWLEGSVVSIYMILYLRTALLYRVRSLAGCQLNTASKHRLQGRLGESFNAYAIRPEFHSQELSQMLSRRISETI